MSNKMAQDVVGYSENGARAAGSSAPGWHLGLRGKGRIGDFFEAKNFGEHGHQLVGLAALAGGFKL
ncbi:hypothetical protein GCM10027511_24220 [Hymenobacter humi]